MSDSLQSHGLWHSRLLCPPLPPEVCSNSCPLSWWCYLTISSSASLFSFCLQSFPASGSFPMSWLIASGGQSIEVSTPASVLPRNIQVSFLDWFPFWLIRLQSKGLSRVFSSTTVWNHPILNSSLQSSLLGHTWISTLPSWALMVGNCGYLAEQ